MSTPDQFESAVSLLYESILDSGQWMDAMAGVARFLDAPRASRFRFNGQTGEVWDFSALGFEDAVQKKYLAYYGRLDPAWTVAITSRVGVWIGDQEVLDVRAKSQQEYVRDFAIPSGIGHLGGAKVASSEESAVYFSVQREPGAPRFGQAGREAFDRLMPHLMRAEMLRDRVESLSDGQAIARATLDQFGASAFVVDSLSRPRAANKSAEVLLAEGSSAVLLHGKVCLRGPRSSRQFVEAVRQAMPPTLKGSSFLLPPSSNRGSLQVLILPLAHATALARVASDKSLALILIADPFATHLSTSVYRSLFALSDAEASLAAAIAHGSSLSEWALARGVAVSTARSQLATVFQKTGCGSQPQLVRLLRALPAITRQA